MKTIAILILFLFTGACSSKSPQEKREKKIKEQYETAEASLSDQKEKIALLSCIKHISYDTLYLILREYIALSSDPIVKPENEQLNYTKAIDTISNKMNIPKSKIASLIFSFKYELKTKDDIIEELDDEAQDDAEYDADMDR